MSQKPILHDFENRWSWLKIGFLDYYFLRTVGQGLPIYIPYPLPAGSSFAFPTREPSNTSVFFLFKASFIFHLSVDVFDGLNLSNLGGVG
jgi:hypothetical protein